MAEELYFFRFDKEAARANLPALLTAAADYRQQIAELPTSRYDEPVIFENILLKIDENVELLSIEEMWSLFNWFYEKAERENPEENYFVMEKRLHEEMRFYGLDLFAEIPSKSPVRAFHATTWHYDVEALTGKDDLLARTTADDLRTLLDYMICYSGEVNIYVNRHHYNRADDDEYTLEIRQLINEINRQRGHHIHQLALAEFEEDRLQYDIAMQLKPRAKSFRQHHNHRKVTTPHGRLSYLYRLMDKIWDETYVIYSAKEIKEKLGNYQGLVTRLHSF
ncbi:hypothetical protein [Mucilaginibacter sp. CSA2-8R]|uniref:hypothetical protein n=1 Tax=Mucilaginibacter sp. CSA2-8R TaxID=3141542 RepID=UPI00315D9B9B